MKAIHPTEDKTLWSKDRFDAAVRERVKELVSDDIIQEYRINRSGPHSDPVMRILNYFRRASTSGKYAIFAVQHFARYRIIRLSGRRTIPPEWVGDETYPTRDEADYAVFLLRIGELTGPQAEPADADFR